MLLTIDIGSSTVKLGLYELYFKKYFLLIDKQSEYRKIILNFLYRNGLSEKDVNDVIICSSDDYHQDLICSAVKSIFKIEPVIISSEYNYGVKLNVPDPYELSSDMIVMSSYALSKFSDDILIISFSTTTTFIYIDKQRQLSNFIYVPGFEGYCNLIPEKISCQLDELKYQFSYKANTNETALSVGIINGYLGIINQIINNLTNEVFSMPHIIACGGNGKALIPYLSNIEYYEPDMVSEGLNYIFNTFIHK